MILQFMQDIGYEEFLKHAKKTTALVEIAKFYENPFETAENLTTLIQSF